MIDVGDSNKYADCMGCLSQEELFEINISHKNGNHTQGVCFNLCRKCKNEFINKFADAEMLRYFENNKEIM